MSGECDVSTFEESVELTLGLVTRRRCRLSRRSVQTTMRRRHSHTLAAHTFTNTTRQRRLVCPQIHAHTHTYAYGKHAAGILSAAVSHLHECAREQTAYVCTIYYNKRERARVTC